MQRRMEGPDGLRRPKVASDLRQFFAPLFDGRIMCLQREQKFEGWVAGVPLGRVMIDPTLCSSANIS